MNVEAPSYRESTGKSKSWSELKIQFADSEEPEMIYYMQIRSPNLVHEDERKLLFLIAQKKFSLKLRIHKYIFLIFIQSASRALITSVLPI
jgi:hypothetical protein